MGPRWWAFSAKHVRALIDCLQVIGADAQAVSAEVIDYCTVRNFANMDQVGQAVDAKHVPRLDPDLPIAVA
jgi:hypothetical protein